MVRAVILTASLVVAAAVLAAFSTPNSVTAVASRKLPGIDMAYYRVLGVLHRSGLYVSIPGLPSGVRAVTIDAYGLSPGGKPVSLGHYRAARGPVAIPLERLRSYAAKWVQRLHGVHAEPPLLLLVNIYTASGVYFAPMGITLDPYLLATGKANLVEVKLHNLAGITEAKKPLLSLRKSKRGTGFPPPWLPPTRPPYSYYPDLEWRLRSYTWIGTTDIPAVAIHVHGDPNMVQFVSANAHLEASQSKSISVMIGATGVEYQYEQSVNGETAKEISTDFVGFTYRLDSCAVFDASFAVGAASSGGLPTPAHVYEPAFNGIVSDAVDAPQYVSDYVVGAGIRARLVQAEYQLYSTSTGYWLPIYFNTTLGQIALDEGAGCDYMEGWGEASLDWPTAAVSLRPLLLSSRVKAVDLSPASHYFQKYENYKYNDYLNIGVSVPLEYLMPGNPFAALFDIVISYESSSSASSSARVILKLGPGFDDGRCHIFPREYVSSYNVYYGSVQIPLRYYLFDVSVDSSGVGYCSS